jgi:hypothetical protein
VIPLQRTFGSLCTLLSRGLSDYKEETASSRTAAT